MAKTVAKILPKATIAGQLWRGVDKAITPDLPDPEEQVIEPPTAQSASAAGMAAEQSLLRRKGLAATKKVRQTLGGGKNLGGR